MKHIISATNRPDSNSYQVALILQNIYKQLGHTLDIISLKQVPFELLIKKPYPQILPKEVQNIVATLNSSSGFAIVCPEYNGSFPGIFKFFIDHWSYPATFEYRPMCFVGLGGRFGGLRAVEQLQQIMGYRNAFIYPQRIFLQNIEDILHNHVIKDQNLMDLLVKQAKGFLKFVSALEEKKLTANYLV